MEAFGAVHTKVQAGDEKNELDLRGKGLRELEEFFKTYDKKRDYAGLRRIGDPSDGTAVWTRLTDPEEVKAAIEKRAAQRRAEMKRHDALVEAALDESIQRDAARGSGAAGVRALA